MPTIAVLAEECHDKGADPFAVQSLCTCYFDVDCKLVGVFLSI